MAEPQSAVPAHARALEALSFQQEAFCRAFLQHGGNATQAAIHAGYSRSNASRQGCLLLKQERIQARLAELAEEWSQRTAIQLEHILLEAYNLARSDLGDFLEWDELGRITRVVRPAELPAHQRRQIRKIKSKTKTRSYLCPVRDTQITETETEFELELHQKAGPIKLLWEALSQRKGDIRDVLRKMFAGLEPGDPGRLVGPARSLLHELTRPHAFWSEGLSEEKRARVVALMEPLARELAKATQPNPVAPGETE